MAAEAATSSARQKNLPPLINSWLTSSHKTRWILGDQELEKRRAACYEKSLGEIERYKPESASTSKSGDNLAVVAADLLHVVLVPRLHEGLHRIESWCYLRPAFLDVHVQRLEVLPGQVRRHMLRH